MFVCALPCFSWCGLGLSVIPPNEPNHWDWKQPYGKEGGKIIVIGLENISKNKNLHMKETINPIYWIGNNNWKTRKYTLKKLLGQSMLIEWYTVKFRGKIYWEILGEKPTRGTESLLSQKVINIYHLKTPPHPMTHLETNWEYEPFQSQFILLQKKTLFEQFW